MADISVAPDLGALGISDDWPIDHWTEPFWQAAAREELILPRCGDCEAYRWPPGPFCPHCHSQRVEWRPAGLAKLYSYTVIHQPASSEAPPRLVIPGLVSFPDAGGVRILAPIVGAVVDHLSIDANLRVGFVAQGNIKLPVFSPA